MHARALALVLAAAAVLIGAVALSHGRATPTREERRPDPSPVEADTREHPPELPPLHEDADAMAQWISMVEAGDDEDVAWAKSRLRLAGDVGRSVLRDAGQARLGSNPAFVEQVLQFLEESPRPEDLEFARSALSEVNSSAVQRASRIIAAIPVPPAQVVATSHALAAAGAHGGIALRSDLLRALAHLGGDVAAEDAIRVLTAAPAGEFGPAYAALSAFDHPKIRAALHAAFMDPPDALAQIAAARALIVLGDRSLVPWLRERLASPSERGIDVTDAVLDALAVARDPDALARIGAVVANPLEGTPARLVMIERLAHYPLDAKRTYLEKATEPAGSENDVRVEALDALLRAGDAQTRETVSLMVRQGDAASVVAASLVLGRFHDPAAAPALTEALSRSDLDEETRAFVLRALVLTSDPGSAGTIVRAMASDSGPFEAPSSLAGNAGALLHETKPELKEAIGAELLRAYSGAYGTLSGTGLVHLVRAAAVCCGPEAAAAVRGYLGHEDAKVRTAALFALGFVADAETERDLRAAWWRMSGERHLVARSIVRAHYRVPDALRAGGRR